MKSIPAHLLVAAAGVFFWPAVRMAAQTPKAAFHQGALTDLGPSSPLAINDNGVVVGGVWITSEGKSTILMGPFGDGAGTNLVAVNNRGQILVAQKFGPLRYFLYDPVRKDLTPVGLFGQVNEGSTARTIYLVYLTGLDDEGRVFGVYGGGHGACAVVGKPTLGVPGDLGPPPSAPANYTLMGCPGAGDLLIRGVNAKGQITGSVLGQGFLWSGGKLTTFAFPGAISTQGVAINEAGTVVGVYNSRCVVSETGVVNPDPHLGLSFQKGFVYDGQQFRNVDVPQSWSTLYKTGVALYPLGIFVNGVNNRGQIVGYYPVADFFVGFLAEIDKLPIARMVSKPQN
jgi:hypothetical protein